jgi:hypothetical protein
MNIENDRGLREALQALAQEPAPEQLWSQIASRLSQNTVTALRPRRRIRSWAKWLALAAGISALAITVDLGHLTVAQQSTTDTTLAALQEQSLKLEQRLASLRSNDTRYSVRAARLEQSLADGLALTDLQLSVASEPQIATQLWQRRVALLSTWLDLNAIGPQLGDADTAPVGTPSNTKEPWL